MEQLTYRFDEIDLSSLSQVGGKNASLGELRKALTSEGVQTPDGFALAADAYWKYLDQSKLGAEIYSLLESIERPSYSNLSSVGQSIRELILARPLPEVIREAISSAYRDLTVRIGNTISVAVRSSATAEDLPTASFAGQQESYLNVQGIDEVVNACHRCYASLFTDRAIKYREDNGFDHHKVALSVGVQEMVRSDLACAGVAFTIDPETGHDGVIFITGSWGLGENVVQGSVNPDEFIVFKESLRRGKHAIISRKLGSKARTMVYGEASAKVLNVETSPVLQNSFVLLDQELEQLGKWILAIEKHYGRPMDIEWAKDGVTNQLFIVQARPETVHSQKKLHSVVEYRLTSSGRELTRGEGLGNKIVTGWARLLKDVSECASLIPGDIIVTSSTNPDWDPVLKKAAGIITDRGGRTSHAAIVAREIGTCAVVGCGNATQTIKEGQQITVVTSQGEAGIVYDGMLSWETIEHELNAIPKTRTRVMLIMADPTQALRLSHYPVDGIGLLRMEFAINNSIRIHPMALVHPDRILDEEVNSAICKMIVGYDNGQEYFVRKLSEAVGTIAAAFYPRDVIVRMSDFKTNEYAHLLGGSVFEPDEENPMLGFRGASRYYDDRYRDGFALECKAMKRVRDEMGLTNVKLMIPFCRTVEEGKQVLDTMRINGLAQGDNELEIYVMAEVPSNILLVDEFAKIFDGFSIGSNDLTQLTLGIDRDSELVCKLFDENNGAVTQLIERLIYQAHAMHRSVGLCGQAPSDHPEFAKFLVECGIDSIAFNPDAVFQGIANIHEAEVKTARVIPATEDSTITQLIEYE